jgi:A/G-specific adenine glycosylase
MKALWQIAGQLTPTRQTGEYNQAMMDLGAMVCVKSNPRCEVCPLTDSCASYQQGTQASFPAKKPPKPKPNKQTLMLLHRYRDRVLLYRRPPTGIWGGLWSLPEVAANEEIADWQSSYLADTKIPDEIKTDVLKHQFTHYSLDISLAVIDLNKLPKKVADQESIAFVAPKDLSQYGLPTPVRKLLSMHLVPNPNISPLPILGEGQGEG